MLPDYIQHSNAVKAQKRGETGPLWAQLQAAFEGCPAGKSFGFKLPVDKTENYLRSLISKKAKEYNRRFVVVKHDEGWFEIARLFVEVQPVEEVPE